MPDTYHLPPPTPVRLVPRETVPDNLWSDFVHHLGTTDARKLLDYTLGQLAVANRELNERDGI